MYILNGFYIWILNHSLSRNEIIGAGLHLKNWPNEQKVNSKTAIQRGWKNRRVQVLYVSNTHLETVQLSSGERSTGVRAAALRVHNRIS